MDSEKIKILLENVSSGEVTVADAMNKLKTLPFEDMDFAKLDKHRALRTGFPEVVFCQGKTTDQVTKIMETLIKHHSTVVATRASSELYEAVSQDIQGLVYNKKARIMVHGEFYKKSSDDTILVVTAGTSDIPVGEEAAYMAEIMGNSVKRLFDVGVAGVHRLFSNVDLINNSSVIIVVAGMDGALPSIIGGMASVPVIAVPTSVGYGASFNGLSALLTMLNSCATGVVVVNIDNGFGAGVVASMINRKNR